LAIVISLGGDLKPGWSGILHRRPDNWSILLALFALLVVFSSVLSGQTSATGALVGKVVDPTGAVIPNAEVQLTNHQTGDADPASSDSTGNFHFLLLAPGSYDLQVNKADFAVSPLSTFQA